MLFAHHGSTFAQKTADGVLYPPPALQRDRMKREDLLIMIVGLLLLAAMLYTLFFGGEQSRHGVGRLHKSAQPGKEIAYAAGQGMLPPARPELFSA